MPFRAMQFKQMKIRYTLLAFGGAHLSDAVVAHTVCAALPISTHATFSPSTKIIIIKQEKKNNEKTANALTRVHTMQTVAEPVMYRVHTLISCIKESMVGFPS